MGRINQDGGPAPDLPSTQVQARALGDPTRHAIFQFVLDAPQPVDVNALIEHTGLNHTTVREHVAKLVAAGLLAAEPVRPTGPGRPPVRYRALPAAVTRWGAVAPYQRLSQLLVEMITTGDPAMEVGRRAGRRLRITGGPDGAADIAGALDRQGFHAQVHRHERGAQVVLQHCPFAAAAIDDPDTICTLHRGIAEGLAEHSGYVVDELVIEDPRLAGCQVLLSKLPAPPR